jgi:TonB-linked SusC/RagA family outer membrane protein
LFKSLIFINTSMHMRKILMLMLGVFAICAQLLAQNRTVTGTVRDDKGAPLPNVSITVQGTRLGTVTGTDGTYSISVPSTARTLVFSSVDMGTQTMNIGTQSQINVSLQSQDRALDEVVVTGFSRQRRSEYAGAAAKVTAKEIRNNPVASFDQMLQGRAPGLSVLSGSGQPGSAATIILRGPTSITGGSTPLYVVDGIPVEASVFQGINPNDIESVDVLKDASAQALYGSRGAGGVIVVTTRRGQSGKLKVGYSGQYGVTASPSSEYRMMNTQELLAAQEKYGRSLTFNASSEYGVPNTQVAGSNTTYGTNLTQVPGWTYSRNNPTKVIRNAAGSLVTAPKTESDYALGDRILDSLRAIDINWDDIFFRTGTFQRQEVSLSGGTGKTRFYSNLGYFGEEGITLRSDLKRLTWRNNLDFGDDRFTIAISSNIGFTRRNFQESTTTNSLQNPFFATRLTPPYQAPFLPDGKTGGPSGNFNTASGNQYAGPNLLYSLEFNENYSDQLKLIFGANFAYKFMNNFTAGLVTGADYRFTQATFYNDPRTFFNRISTDIRGRTGSISETFDRFMQLTVRPTLNFTKMFNERHEVDVTGAVEYLPNYSRFNSMQGFGIDTRRPNTFGGITQGTVQNQLVPIVSGSRSERSIFSIIGLGRYSFDKRFTLNLSLRNDGSSQLPDENRFKYFYSVGAGWDIAKERFISDVNWITSLRIRGSYGTSANAENFPFGDFGYLPTYALGQEGAGNETLVQSTLGNPNADWEYTKQGNIGVDYSFLKNRLYGAIDVYNKVTENAYATRSLSLTTGFGGLQSNAATVLNRGIEYIINGDIIRGPSLTWTVNVNGSYNKNEVTDLGGIANFQFGTSLITAGYPLGTHWEVEWAGVDPTGRPVYRTLDGQLTNNYSTANRVLKFGSFYAPWIGGFGSNLRFKAFEFSVQFNYQEGSQRFNNLEFFVENPGFLASGLNQASTLNFYGGVGDKGATTQSGAFANQFSSKYIQDASFTRLREATLAYTLPGSITQKLRFLSNARIYAVGRNLYTWTKWRGYDPEDNNNISLSEFPNPRTITFGLDVTF